MQFAHTNEIIEMRSALEQERKEIFELMEMMLKLGDNSPNNILRNVNLYFLHLSN